MKNQTKHRRGLALVMALVMMMALLTGCGASAKKTDKVEPSASASDDPKILRIAAAFDFKKAMEAKSIVFDTLVKSDMDGNFSPWLAESYDVSDDGLTYTFHLKKGVKFHDGSDFNSDTAKLSIEYAVSHTAALKKSVKSVDVIDDNTVEIVMGTYIATLLNTLSSTSSPVICASDLDPAGDPTGELAGFIGTGAFYFDESTYEKSVKAELLRYNDYWAGAAKLDGIEWLVVTDPTAMVVALESDEVDVIGIAEHHSSVPYVQIAELKSKGYTVETDETGRYQVLDYNCSKAPFDDVNVRTAFSLAVDRELMVDTLFEGITHAANVITSPSFVLGPKDLDKDYYKYDFDRATKLLEDAGWIDSDGDGIREKNGTKLEIKMLVPTGEANADSVCVYVQSELLKIGAKVEMLTLDSGAASDMKKVGNYNLYLHHSGNMPSIPGGIGNDGKYHSDGSDTQSIFHSKELDAMMDEAFTNPNEDSRSTQIDEIWTFLHKQAPCMPLYSILKLSAFNPRVSGYVVGSNMFDMSMLSVMDMDMSK